MRHWRSVLPIPIHTVRYEALVTEGEPRMREILGFLGLSWDPGVLAFHQSQRTVRTLSYDQDTRPLSSTSIGRHRHYTRGLEGVEFPVYRDCDPTA
jgi:hypothetical protein